MRTTLTIDDDVAARLKSAVKARRRPLKAVVNEALRAGLAALERRAPARKRYRTTGFDLGPSLAGSLDNIEEVIARVEGDRYK
jgi:predicted transcriptional regulator